MTFSGRETPRQLKIHFQMLGFGIKGGFEVGEKRQQKHFDPDHPHLPLLIRAILIISELNILSEKNRYVQII